MAKWNYAKIGDVCTVERGGSPRPIDKFITDNSNGINWIKIGDTADSMYITETAQKITPEGMKKSRYVQPGDFLLSNSMSFGRPYILKIDGCIHDGWLVLRDHDGVFDKRFLYYYLSSPSTYQKFKNMAVGGVVNNLNSDMVRGVTVPVPKMEEQIEIVQTLDNVSNLIFLRKQQLAKLDELIKSQFVEMFGDPESNPYGYQTKKLGDVLQIERGGSPRPIDKYITESDDGVNWIKIGDAEGGSIYITHTKERIIPEGAKKSRHVFPGDFLLSNSMSFGKPYILRIDGYIHDGWLVLRDHNGSFDKSYLYALLSSEYAYRAFQSFAAGSVVKNLNKEVVAKVEVLIPPMEVQMRYADFLTQADKSKLAVQKGLRELETLKKALMQKYFR